MCFPAYFFTLKCIYSQQPWQRSKLFLYLLINSKIVKKKKKLAHDWAVLKVLGVHIQRCYSHYSLDRSMLSSSGCQSLGGKKDYRENNGDNDYGNGNKNNRLFAICNVPFQMLLQILTNPHNSQMRNLSYLLMVILAAISRAILWSPEFGGRVRTSFYSNSVILSNTEDQGRLSWGNDFWTNM